MKILDTVSIIAINKGAADPMIKALDDNLKTIDGFFQVKKTVLLTDLDIKHPVHEIKKIPRLNNFDQLNLFCIKDLWRYIDTDHYMIVQPDGYIINPGLWKDEWLEYDYIGAPWADLVMKDRKGNPAIGNGGFCLRSKTFSKFISKKYMFIPLPLIFNEDGYYSNKMNYEPNIKYPTVEKAMEFSQEELIDKNIKPFGIHGAPNKIAYKYWVLNERV